MGVAALNKGGVQHLSSGAKPTTFGPNASNQSLSGFRKAIHSNRGRAGRLRQARASGVANRLAKPAARAAQARAAQVASNAALKQGLTGARAGTSVLPLSGKAAAGGGSLSAAGTVAAGVAALGGGLVLGNAIYEGIGRPFGPSLGDYVRSKISDGIGQQPAEDARLPQVENQRFDPETWGEDNKRYNVDYKHWQLNVETGSRVSEKTRLATGVLGPIGTDSLTEQSPEGKTSKSVGLISPTGKTHYLASFRERSAINLIGSSNIEWRIPYIEILDVIEVDGTGVPVGDPIDPNPLPTIYPGWPAPAPATAPEANLQVVPATAPALAISPATVPGIAPAPATVPGTAPATAPGIAPDFQPSIRPAPAPATTPGTRPLTAPSTTPGTRPGTAPSTPQVTPSITPQLPTIPGVNLPVSRPTIPDSVVPEVNKDPLDLIKNNLSLPEPRPTINQPPTTTTTKPDDCQCTPGIASALDDVVSQKVSNKLDDICNALNVSGLGTINLPSCEGETNFEAWGGKGLVGIYNAFEALSSSLETIWDRIKCEPEILAAVPMPWEAKVQEHEQLIVLWGPSDGGTNRWSMHIPHPKKTINKDYRFAFPAYRKGKTTGRLVLSDNTMLIVNGASKAECIRVMNYCKQLIDDSYLKDFREIFSESSSSNNQIVDVRATYIKAYSGHRTNTPLWAKSLVG